MITSPIEYVTRPNDMIDRICWRNYGRDHYNGAIEAVLEANWHIPIITRVPVLPGGIRLILPVLPAPKQGASDAQGFVNIWGE